MDPSALIFVALAVAWAVYLIPKALEHHEASDRTRTIDRFSHRLRVLGRRVPVDRRSARLMKPAEPAKAPAPAPVAAEPVRASAASAARRRRRVLAVILLALVATVVGAALGAIAMPWVAAPVAVLVAWLVACRLMVRKEHAAAPVRRAPAAPAPARADEPTAEDETPTGEVPAVAVAAEESDDETADSAVGRWDPVDVPLPTYVTKPTAARTVRTIDLDSTGVWSSAHNEADSALAREADAARGSESAQQARRRTGS